ncbi:unnamed protein product [Heligmosomoides polygyrus]|uniref:MADF domain-containing protein n=1 Tax=Heligmosomoides polygyrus TaxID=6339 RepID=A0A3P7ZYR8_HELPZ|nr:unnamed protein product [Heligmosomoides polygyrus]
MRSLHCLQQYPCTADDHFEIRLIDAVEKNPCIFNRCHPLHKMSDYKSHVWNQLFSGPGVELERKWRHMRDRYVRLRKIDKTSAPLKKGDKWYYYYKKMSFLDPYIEHRNRRKRGDLMTSLMKLGGNGLLSVLFLLLQLHFHSLQLRVSSIGWGRGSRRIKWSYAFVRNQTEQEVVQLCPSHGHASPAYQHGMLYTNLTSNQLLLGFGEVLLSSKQETVPNYVNDKGRKLATTPTVHGHADGHVRYTVSPSLY